MTDDKITFEVTSRTATVDGFTYIGYGIAVRDAEKILYEADDLTNSKAKAVALAALMRDNDVAAVHIPDVVEDFLSCI